MTMRTWPPEGESIRIYPFTRLYENGVSVGSRFKSVRFAYLFRWLNVHVSIKRTCISTLSQCKRIRVNVA